MLVMVLLPSADCEGERGVGGASLLSLGLGFEKGQEKVVESAADAASFCCSVAPLELVFLVFPPDYDSEP
jgi:hypothetical protein